MNGLLHRIWVDLKCERCGKLHETDIRFYNYLIDYEGPDYKLGERVTDPYMITGETYEGNADRYCPACYRKWTEAQSLLSYESLVELIEQGRVTARDRDTGATLTPHDVLEAGRRYTEEEVTNVPYLDITGPYFTEFQLVLDHERVVEDLEESFGDPNWQEFLELHAPLVERRLIEAGWKPASITYEDFDIYLDDDRRLVVKDQNGKRLLERGERAA